MKYLWLVPMGVFSPTPLTFVAAYLLQKLPVLGQAFSLFLDGLCLKSPDLSVGNVFG